MFMNSLEKQTTLDPPQQVLDYLTGGLVTLFIGVALMMAARLGMTVLAIPGLVSG